MLMINTTDAFVLISAAAMKKNLENLKILYLKDSCHFYKKKALLMCH
jgi:hypothetical protein